MSTGPGPAGPTTYDHESFMRAARSVSWHVTAAEAEELGRLRGEAETYSELASLARVSCVASVAAFGAVALVTKVLFEGIFAYEGGFFAGSLLACAVLLFIHANRLREKSQLKIEKAEMLETSYRERGP